MGQLEAQKRNFSLSIPWEVDNIREWRRRKQDRRRTSETVEKKEKKNAICGWTNRPVNHHSGLKSYLARDEQQH